jgi:hypothetical protein
VREHDERLSVLCKDGYNRESGRRGLLVRDFRKLKDARLLVATT